MNRKAIVHMEYTSSVVVVSSGDAATATIAIIIMRKHINQKATVIAKMILNAEKLFVVVDSLLGRSARQFSFMRVSTWPRAHRAHQVHQQARQH